METHRRQQGSRGHLARTDQLLDFEQFDLPLAGRAVGDDRVAGAEIDADDVLFFHCTDGFSQGSTLPSRPITRWWL
jgi:hypothetical protein